MAQYGHLFEFIKGELLTGGQYRRCLEDPATYRHAMYRMLFLDYLVRDLLEGVRRDLRKSRSGWTKILPRHLKARPIPNSSGSPRCVEIAGDAGLHRSDCMARSFRRRPERGSAARASAPCCCSATSSRPCRTNSVVRRRIELAAADFGQMCADVQTDLRGAVTTWQGIGTNVDCITTNINRLTMPRWYDRLLGYGLSRSKRLRDLPQLNPPANLTIKGAQIVSPRP